MKNIIFSKSRIPIPILNLYTCVKIKPISNSKRVIAFNKKYFKDSLDEVSYEKYYNSLSRKSSVKRSLHSFLNHGLLIKIKMVKGGRVY